jgi:hypothetical protein
MQFTLYPVAEKIFLILTAVKIRNGIFKRFVPKTFPQTHPARR